MDLYHRKTEQECRPLVGASSVYAGQRLWNVYPRCVINEDGTQSNVNIE